MKKVRPHAAHLNRAVRHAEGKRRKAANYNEDSNIH